MSFLLISKYVSIVIASSLLAWWERYLVETTVESILIILKAVRLAWKYLAELEDD